MDSPKANITLKNLYACKNIVLKYIRQKLIELQENIDKSRTTSGDTHTTVLGIA